jgi:hypothetical protein
MRLSVSRLINTAEGAAERVSAEPKDAPAALIEFSVGAQGHAGTEWALTDPEGMSALRKRTLRHPVAVSKRIRPQRPINWRRLIGIPLRWCVQTSPPIRMIPCRASSLFKRPAWLSLLIEAAARGSGTNTSPCAHIQSKGRIPSKHPVRAVPSCPTMKMMENHGLRRHPLTAHCAIFSADTDSR